MKYIKRLFKEVPVFNVPYRFYRTIKGKIFVLQMTEREVKNVIGKKRNKPIYIIRRVHKAGFFSNFFFVLGHVIYAEQNGFDPIVDMQHYPTLYNEKQKIDGKRNAWEYYFEQPSDLSVIDGYFSRNIILSSGDYQYQLVPYYEGTLRKAPDRKQIEYLEPYIRKYIKINPNVSEEAKSIREQWGEKVLGIHIRGTDMKSTPNHPVPPLISQFMDAVDDVCSKRQVENIFLCTDERIILEQMKHKYGDKIVFTNAYRSADGKSVHKDHKDETRENHHYLMGKEVLIDMLVLSLCDYLIYGHSNVAYAALVFNMNRYEDSRLIENKNQDKNLI